MEITRQGTVERVALSETERQSLLIALELCTRAAGRLRPASYEYWSWKGAADSLRSAVDRTTDDPITPSFPGGAHGR